MNCKLQVMTLVVFGAGNVLWGQSAPRPGSAPDADLLTRSELRQRVPGSRHPVRALLTKRVDAVNFEESSLSEVFDWLRGQTTEVGAVNIVPNWKALSTTLSVDEETPVTLTMRNATVSDVLDEVLAQLSDDVNSATYVGIGNRLKVSTRKDFDAKLITRSYDVSDLMFKVKNFGSSPQIDLSQQQMQGGGGGGQGGMAQVQSVFGGQGGGGQGQDEDEEEDEEDDERADQLMEWIRNTVEPTSWQEDGGLGRLSVFNKQLIVHNTLSVHEQLGGFVRLDD